MTKSHGWSVVSSNGDDLYLVSRDQDGAWACTCPDHVYRQHECKHIRLIKQNYRFDTETRERRLQETIDRHCAVRLGELSAEAQSLLLRSGADKEALIFFKMLWTKQFLFDEVIRLQTEDLV